MSTTRWLVTEGTFAQTFPSLADINVKYVEKGVFSQGTATETRNFTQGSSSEALHCHNPRCQRGGLHLQGEIASMVALGESERDFNQKCPGDEGSPGGVRKGEPCFNRFEGRIRLRYKG